MKHQIIQTKDQYTENKNKKGSVAIEMIMTVDDGASISPFVQMFKIDDFREESVADIEKIIFENSKFIARKFYQALTNREDCLGSNKVD